MADVRRSNSLTHETTIEMPGFYTTGPRVLLVVLLSAVSLAADEPRVRLVVDPSGFGDSRADIEAVCRSAGRQLWRHMESMDGLVIQVGRGKDGPITFFRRGNDGEFRVRLDTGDQAWSQYSYQFAHEVCHVLCNGSDDFTGNLWFEETLCETASLFCLRRMSREWRRDAPYSNWRSYAPSLGDYADDVVRSRAREYLAIVRDGLPAYYRANAAHLREHPTDRSRNGAMAVVLLAVFEENPKRWDALRWLNSTPSPKGETFAEYLAKWRAAVPKRHTEFVESIAKLYGVDLPWAE